MTQQEQLEHLIHVKNLHIRLKRGNCNFYYEVNGNRIDFFYSFRGEVICEQGIGQIDGLSIAEAEWTVKLFQVDANYFTRNKKNWFQKLLE